MAETEKSHYSKWQLSAGERIQQVIGRTRAGRSLIRTVAGSPSPFYRLVTYQSWKLLAEIPDAAEVPGDPDAGGLARWWGKAMIMAAPAEGIQELKEQAGARTHQEAVAYIADNVVHVGTKAIQGYLFERLHDEDKVAFGMRLGTGPLVATMGIWLPDDRHFMGAAKVDVVEPAIEVNDMMYEYPGILHN